MQGNSWLWKDNQFQALTFIPVEDRGFRYGMSVFETIAVIEGKAILAAEHIQRLEIAAASLEFPIEQSALSGIMTLLEHPPLQEGLLRIHWTAGDGGPADALEEGRMIVRCEEIVLPGNELAPVPELSLVEFQVAFHELDSWKTGNYLKRCQLLAHARHKCRVEEALLWDVHSGLLVSAIMANVFLVTDAGQLMTPSLKHAGCRNGTVREWLIRHHAVEEKDITSQDVTSAREILLTNSRLGIASARSLEPRKFERGPISQKIQDSYRNFLSHVYRRP